jgi:O-antigen ligase
MFYEYFNHENILGFKSNYEGRIASFLNEELKIANFVLGFSFLTISFLLTRKLSNKSNIYLFFCYSLLILTVTAIIITGERSNSIRAIFIFIFLIIFSDNKLFKYKYLIATILILSTILTYNTSPIKFKYKDQTIKPIIENGLIKTFKDSQYGAHYVTSIEIFKSYPLLGVGNKNFRNECKKEKYFRNDYLFSNSRCATHPHQIYLEFLSEHGLIGTIIILGIIFFILYKNIIIFRKKKNLMHLSSILYVLQTFLPIIPSGSFFTSWTATIFWINFAFMIFLSNNKKIF